MFGGCVLDLRLKVMDLLCILRNYVLPHIAFFHGSTLYHWYPWCGHHHRSVVYWSTTMIGLDKVNYWSYMILSLFSPVINRKLANYFTYHFLLASYFLGHSIAPRNITLLIILQENSTLPFNLLARLDWVTLVMFFPYLEETKPSLFLRRAPVAPVTVDP